MHKETRKIPIAKPDFWQGRSCRKVLRRFSCAQSRPHDFNSSARLSALQTANPRSTPAFSSAPSLHHSQKYALESIKMISFLRQLSATMEPPASASIQVSSIHQPKYIAQSHRPLKQCIFVAKPEGDFTAILWQ
jgi:hypothetical protein